MDVNTVLSVTNGCGGRRFTGGRDAFEENQHLPVPRIRLSSTYAVTTVAEPLQFLTHTTH